MEKNTLDTLLNEPGTTRKYLTMETSTSNTLFNETGATITYFTTETNTSNTFFNEFESLSDFNERYADALVPVTILLVLFVLVGIPGNLLVLVIFARKYTNSNFRTCVISLAIVDLITCISLIPLEIIKTRSYFMFPYPVTCKLKCFFDMFSRSATSLLLIFICIDRHRKICRPLKPQITPSLTLRIVVVLIFVSFILAVPALIMCGVAPMNVLDIHGSNITIQHCSAEEQYIRSLGRIIYKYAMSLLLITIVIALVVFYSLTLRNIVMQTKAMTRFTRSFSESSGSHANASTDIIELGAEKQSPPLNLSQVSRKESESTEERKLSNLSTTKFSFSANTRHPKTNRSLSTSSSVSFSTRRRLSSVFGKRARPYKTLIWFVLTIIFLVTNVLYAVMSFWSAKHYRLSPSQLAGFVTAYRLYYINNIINPVVYAFIDRLFKKSCKQIVCRGKC